METVTKKTATNLTTESVSILTQEFEVETVTETRIEMQTKTESQTKIELQKQSKTEIQIVDGEEVEVDVEVEVPVEVEVEVEVEVPVEVEVEVEKETQVGSNHRIAYSNSVSGREMLITNEPEETVTEVMSVWGDEPTVEEVKFDENYVPEPTIEDRVASLEEKVENGSSDNTWDEIAKAIQEGVNEV